jgi:hypothetical protein
MGKPAPSASDLLALFVAEVQSRRPDLAFRDGDVSEAMGYGAVAMADAILGYAAVRERNLFFGGATEGDLDVIIMDRLGLAREAATRAYGQVTFTRASGPTGNAGTIPSGTQIGTDVATDGSRVIVATDIDLTIPTGAGSWTVNVTAVDYGASGRAQAGSLRNIVDRVLGGDNTLTVTNAEDLAGGNDSQSDEDYAAAARQLWQTQRKGTLDAIEAGALTVPGVSVAVTSEDLMTGITTLFVSDANGNSNGRMIRDVEATLEDWRAAGSLIDVVGGYRADIDLTISIDEYERGFDVAAASDGIIASVTTRINRLRVGQDLTLDSLVAAVIAPYATSITKVSFPSIVKTVRGYQSIIYNDDIASIGALIRVGAAPVIVDGAA